MNWQIVIVIVFVIVSGLILLKRFYKTLKKPQSACDSCLMKDNCGMECEDMEKSSEDHKPKT